MTPDVWDDAERLERYVGRWSRLVAREFVDWLGRAAGQPLARRRLRLRRAHRDPPRARRAGRGRRGRHVGGVRRVRRRAPDRSPRVVRRRRCAGPRPSRRVLRCRREQPRPQLPPRPRAGRRRDGARRQARRRRRRIRVGLRGRDAAHAPVLGRRRRARPRCGRPRRGPADGGVQPSRARGALLGRRPGRGRDARDRRAHRVCRLRRLLGAVRGRPGAGARLLRLAARGSPRRRSGSGFARRSPSRRTARYG